MSDQDVTSTRRPRRRTPPGGPSRVLGPLAGRRAKWVVAGLALAASGVFLGVAGEAEPVSDTAASLPADAESARAADVQESLPSSGVSPAIAVFTREDGSALEEADLAAVGEATGRGLEVALPLLEEAGLDAPAPGGEPGGQPGGEEGGEPGGAPSGPQVSEDGTTALSAVPLPADLPAEELGTHRRGAAHRPARRPAGRPAGRRHRRPGLRRRHRCGVRRRRHHPARLHRRHRRGAAAHHLPQPVAVAGAPHRRGPRRPGRRQAARRPQPGHRPARRRRRHRDHLGARVRRRHQLRAAADRPLPRGAAARGGPARGDAPRARVRGAGDPRQRRHGDPGPARARPGRRPVRPLARLRRGRRHHRRAGLRAPGAAGRDGAVRPPAVLAVRPEGGPGRPDPHRRLVAGRRRSSRAAR